MKRFTGFNETFKKADLRTDAKEQRRKKYFVQRCVFAS